MIGGQGARVQRRMRLLMALAAGTVLVGGAAGASVATKSKKVSTEAYAKTMCNTYNRFIADVNAFVTAMGSLEIADNASFQADVGAAGAELLTALKKAETKLKGVYPDIDDGKRVSKLFAKNPVELQVAISGALTTFTAADPNGVAFQADIALLEATLATLNTKLTDVAPQITDQDLIGSIDDQKVCHERFPVTGGS